MTARQFAKHRETFCLASAGSDEEFHAYLSGFDAAVAIADLAAVPAQVRKKFPVLGSGGASVDLQLVEDHGEQAKKNHYQTIMRLAERGGLCWAELFAVLHNRPFQKIDTNEAMIACRALEARYLAALEPQPDHRDETTDLFNPRDSKDWYPIHRSSLDRLGDHASVRSGLGKLSPDACRKLGMTDEEAKAIEALWSLCANADFYTVAPDPRDEAIARLVEAATHLCDGIATMLPPLGQSDRVLNLRAALAAAKAVQHG